jgi:glucokinase
VTTLNYRAAISIDMGGTKIYGIVQRLSGEVLSERTIATQQDETGDAFSRLVTLINELHEDANAHSVYVAGIGVGVPGMTADGRVIAAPALRWLDEPIGKRLTAHFGLPVVVENDANLAALGEYRYGAAQGASSLICIAVGTGIGAGIVINGALVRGAHHSAGEIGYMTVDPAQFSSTYSSADFGAFEQLASGTGIAAYARRLRNNDRLTTEAVVGAAERGEPWAQQVIDETIKTLTLGLVSVTALLDPEVVVLTGGVMRNPALFIDPLTTQMKRLIPFQPRIVASTLGPRAAALGATELVRTTGLHEQ